MVFKVLPADSSALTDKEHLHFKNHWIGQLSVIMVHHSPISLLELEVAKLSHTFGQIHPSLYWNGIKVEIQCDLKNLEFRGLLANMWLGYVLHSEGAVKKKHERKKERA